MPALKGRCRNTDGSTSGSRPARCRRTWYQPNPASTSTDAAIIPNSQAGHAQRVTLRQREDEHEHGRPGQQRARQVQPPRPARPGQTSGQRPRAERQRGQPDGHVHQEDHPPAGAEHVGADQPPAAIGPSIADRPINRPVDAERPAHLVRLEHVPDQAETPAAA